MWTDSNGIVSCPLNSTMDSSKIAIVYRSAVQDAEISIIVYRAMPRQAHSLSADAVELVFSGHPMGHDQLGTLSL